ncbi:MAG: hypothetical protein Q9227_002428 [Pyrenula ochraceoflavens]
MRFIYTLVTVPLLFSSSIFAVPEPKGDGQRAAKNGTMSNSLDHQCAKMASLEQLSKLAANQSKVDEIVAKKKLSDTKAADFKAKVANASTELQAMQSNTTLVSDCGVVDAHFKLKVQCNEMDRLMTMKQIADNNATALTDFLTKHKIDSKNQTAVNHVKEKAANSTMRLNKLMSNSTLMSDCEGLKAEQQKGSSSATQSGSAQAASSTSMSGAAHLALSVTGLSAALSVMMWAVIM